MTSRIAFLLAITVLMAPSCTASEGRTSRPGPTLASEVRAEQAGLAFARARCAGCHSVARGVSPNPQAPTFEAVINTPGLDFSTLSSWLGNSHDFPAMMNFTIDSAEVDNLASYMLTLKDPGYRRAND